MSKNIFPILVINLILLFTMNLLGQVESNNVVAENAKAKLLTSFSVFKADEASALIDYLRREVEKNPGSKGFMVVHCGKVCQFGEVEAHLRGINLALELKHVDSKQFVVISGGFKEKTTTEFWLVPENECPPLPNSTIDFKDVIFKGNYKKKYVDYECC